MRLLLDDRLAPMTSEIGFLEKDPLSCAEAFIKWQSPLHEDRGVSFDLQSVNGDLVMVLHALLPLTDIEARRYLFLPTASQWTACFDNGWSGGDPASVVSYLAGSMGCRGIRAVCVPHTIRRHSNSREGRYGAVILEVYKGTDPLEGNTQRSIYAANDGGRWVFGAHGEELEFERPEAYRARRARDRFTPGMLGEYLGTLGIDLFSDGFYSTGSPAHLVAKVGPIDICISNAIQ